MRYFYYECENHGRLEEEGYHVKRKGVVKEIICKDCNQTANIKFMIYCKHHGELQEENIKKGKNTHGTCRLCHRKTSTRVRDENRELFNKNIAEDKKNNPEKWKKIYKRAYQNKRELDGELHSLKKVCQKRGITLERYVHLLNEQNERCAICNKEETCIDGRSPDKRPRRLSIDHCHTTNKVRGLLCHACNLAIGKFKDDINLMQKAIDYIKAHGCEVS